MSDWKLPLWAHSIACQLNREDDEDWSMPPHCTCGAEARMSTMHVYLLYREYRFNSIGKVEAVYLDTVTAHDEARKRQAEETGQYDWRVEPMEVSE